jgi:trimeric autotransporter adhesin
LIVPCYINGDPQDSGTATEAALVSVPYNFTAPRNDPNATYLARIPQVGTVWATTYDKYRKALYSAAFVRRHMGMGPGGLGAIYKTDLTTNATTTLVDVTTLGVNLGSIADNATRGLGAKTAQSADAQGFTAVGKVGMGGMDISEDGNSLYFMNLFQKKLHVLNLSSLSQSAEVAIPDPGCENGSTRPWAVKIYKGYAYVGVVCDASTSKSAGDLRAYVYRMNLTTNVFDTNPVFDFPLTYPKGFAFWVTTSHTGWYPWSDDWKDVFFTNGFAPWVGVMHPVPILTDIAFDTNGSIVLGIGDRTGFQTGFQNWSPEGSGSYSNVLGGDILRGYYQNGSYVLENNAKAGPAVGSGVNNGQGPGFGEFYSDNQVTDGIYAHAETAMGGLAIRPGSGETIYTAVDPLDNVLNAGGFRWISNSTGNPTSIYEVYTGGASFAKAAFGKMSTTMVYKIYQLKKVWQV